MFHEIYGSYFLAVTEILGKAVDGTLDGKTLRKIVNEKAFAESGLSIPDALERGEWRLLDEEYDTPLMNPPERPMTLLEKRWLKSLLFDPRIQLFSPDATGLEDVKPLFTPDMFVYFDRYEDGDPFHDAKYVEHFHVILRALKEKKWIQVEYLGKYGAVRQFACRPERLEYSSKDDKFRLVCADAAGTMNLARIENCQVLEEAPQSNEMEMVPMRALSGKNRLTLELVDEYGALERVLLHFSHLEKETKRLENHKYKVILHYDKSDEAEILIRVLSFGSKVKVTEPKELIEKIRDRLRSQWS